MDKKICNNCNILKAISEFRVSNRVLLDGNNANYISSKCKFCENERAKLWHRNNKERSSSNSKNYNSKNPQKVSEWAKRSKKRRNDRAIKLKEGKPCMDCGGYFHWCAMDFDHRDNKTKIGNVMKIRECLIKEEVEKCDLVCANCHRLRTFKRNQGKK